LIQRTFFLCVGLCFIAQPLWAQTRVYLAGDVFADITRFSRFIGPEPTGFSRAVPADDVTPGGGGRIGAFFSPAWSLELGVDLGTTQTNVRTVTLRGPIELPVFIRPLTFEARSSIRFAATSVLIGYHPRASGRIRPGFRGGVSVMHTRHEFTVGTSGFDFDFTSTGSTGLGVTSPVGIASLSVNDYKTIGNVLTATLAAEAAITMFERFALVPELRMHAGGLGAIVLRPGVAVRWMF
jgi:hypothetical protein